MYAIVDDAKIEIMDAIGGAYEQRFDIHEADQDSIRHKLDAVADEVNDHELQLQKMRIARS